MKKQRALIVLVAIALINPGCMRPEPVDAGPETRVYSSGRGGLSVYDLATGQRGSVDHLVAWYDAKPAPDGSCVLFSLTHYPEGDVGIWRIPVTVADEALGRTVYWEDIRSRCTRLTTGLTDYEPALSPDGQRVCFRRDGGLALLDVGNGETTFLTPTFDGHMSPLQERGDLRPSWSPSGRQVAFTRAHFGPPEVWILDLDTCEERQLTYGDWGPDRPPTLADVGTHSAAWSPDGELIAAVRNPDPVLPDHPASNLQYGYLVFLDPVSGEDVALWTGIIVEKLVGWTPDGSGIMLRGGHYSLYGATFPDGVGGDTMVLTNYSH